MYSNIIVYHKYLVTSIKVGCATYSLRASSGPNLKSNVTTKNANKNLDNTTIAGRPQTVSGSNNSQPNCVVKPVDERSTFPLTTTAV